jgi:hypothetical protein
MGLVKYLIKKAAPTVLLAGLAATVLTGCDGCNGEYYGGCCGGPYIVRYHYSPLFFHWFDNGRRIEHGRNYRR